MRWALSQPVEKSSTKFLLVAMANCVNGDAPEMICWPTVKHLSGVTAQDRKTVMDGLRRLRDEGYIKDTGERRGATGQVSVYLLKSPESGTVKKVQGAPESGSHVVANGTKNGTGTETGTVPDLDIKSPVSPHEQSQISLETVPKTGHGTNKEPVKNQEGTRKKRPPFDAGVIAVPSWLDRADWLRWVADRKQRGKPITEDAARLQIDSLTKYHGQGYTAREVIDHSIASSYQGLFPPKRAIGKAATSSRHSGFRDFDYEEGLTNGIPDA